jgi:hypothetical protein
MSGQANIINFINICLLWYVKMWHNIWSWLHVLPFHFGQLLGGLLL